MCNSKSKEFVSPEVTEFFCLNLGRSMAIRTTIKAGPCAPPRPDWLRSRSDGRDPKQKYFVTSEDTCPTVGTYTFDAAPSL